MLRPHSSRRQLHTPPHGAAHRFRQAPGLLPLHICHDPQHTREDSSGGGQWPGVTIRYEQVPAHVQEREPRGPMIAGAPGELYEFPIMPTGIHQRWSRGAPAGK